MDRVIGYLRFSVVTEQHKQAYKNTRQASISDALKKILDPSRLEQRIALLEMMPLSSLSQQSDKNFEIRLVTSSRLPLNFKNYLYKFRDKYDFLHVTELDVNDSVGEFFASFPRAGERTITFRIDDDDSLNPNHISDLRKLAVGKRDRVLTNANGLYLQPQGEFFAVENVRYANNAFGIGYISDVGRNIWQAGNHASISPDLMEIGERSAAWIRSIHAGSDSGTKLKGKNVESVHPSEMAERYPDFAFIDFPSVHTQLAAAGEAEIQQTLFSKIRKRIGL